MFNVFDGPIFSLFSLLKAFNVKRLPNNVVTTFTFFFSCFARLNKKGEKRRKIFLPNFFHFWFFFFRKYKVNPATLGPRIHESRRVQQKNTKKKFFFYFFSFFFFFIRKTPDCSLIVKRGEKRKKEKENEKKRGVENRDN